MNTTSSQQPDILASDQERDAIASELGAHFQAGRLDAAELDDRLGRALRARTRGELAELVTDLPRVGAPQEPPAGRRSRATAIAAIAITIGAAALIVTGLTITAGGAGYGHRFWVPWWLIPVVVMFLRARWWRRSVIRNGR
ncbi:MAG TPA: DUF1707 domain-containing protein [Streptosporangiaceae bacterium]|nr:DUF1707 domain-containing protein [Streptosporangiaceae bacterium]